MASPVLTGLLDGVVVTPLTEYKLFENATILDSDLLDLLSVKIELSDPTAGTLVLPETGGLIGAVLDVVNGILTLPLGSPQSLTNALKDVVFIPNEPTGPVDEVLTS